VYLFSTNGMLLTTINNPLPATGDRFGSSLAAVGTDRLLIGAYRDDAGASDTGTAYLFSSNGALLTTFTNPTPTASDWFGVSVTAMGTGRVVIGATGDDLGATDAGAAYLFSTNGTLLTTFTNPGPALSDSFGVSVAAVGTDRVLIGADGDDAGATNAGAAYLFNTNGALLTTFTNPTPALYDRFGVSVAAVGTDRVLIGADYGDMGATDAGAAYLFNTNGALLTTFTNPMPATGDRFGSSLAVMGTDRVLIGAMEDDTGAYRAGAAYLFSTNGALLTTFTNPTPAVSDRFGVSVAALGANRVVVGAEEDDTGAINAGVAFLFSLETYTPGLVAERVSAGSINSTSLQDGAVLPGKLDQTIGVWTRVGEDVFRVSGNVGIGTNSPSYLLHLGGGAYSDGREWLYASDRNVKEQFVTIEPSDVLAKVAALPVTQWKYKTEPEGVKHVGPVAQDFHAAFGLGNDDKAIGTADANGVALAAIQGLNRKLEEAIKAKDAQIELLQQRIEALEKRFNRASPQP
jgi:hypothetical protein